MCHHFVAMQAGPTNLMDAPIGQADCASQLDAFNEAKHIRPNFNGKKNNFAEKLRFLHSFSATFLPSANVQSSCHFVFIEFCFFRQWFILLLLFGNIRLLILHIRLNLSV
jgi:hypothetical protein